MTRTVESSKINLGEVKKKTLEGEGLTLMPEISIIKLINKALVLFL